MTKLINEWEDDADNLLGQLAHLIKHADDIECKKIYGSTKEQVIEVVASHLTALQKICSQLESARKGVCGEEDQKELLNENNNLP